MEKFEFVVEEGFEGVRLDKFLSEKFANIKPEITRSKIQNLIDENLVFDQQNRPYTNCSQKTKINQRIIITIKKSAAHVLKAAKIDFEIIFEDDDLLVINKPAGLTVHPGSGNQDNTLVNALLFTHQNKLSSVNGEFRPGIVHRLDKDTSGLMLVAKNDFAHFYLSEKLRLREIKRSYLAFIYGTLNPKSGVINKNIVRSKVNRLKMAISRTIGRNAVTNYETKEIFCDGFASLIECRLLTGRTHQIRIHLESEKHSLIGDQLYNSCKKNPPKDLSDDIKNFIKDFPRQALHSYKISFEHPRTKQEMDFEIPLPQDLQKLQKYLMQ